MTVEDKVTLGNVLLIAGTGSPNGALTAPRGSLAFERDSAKGWQNTNGSTAWTLRVS